MEKSTVIGVGVIICDIDVLGLVFWRERGKDRETRTERRGQRDEDRETRTERQGQRGNVRQKKGQVKGMIDKQHHIITSLRVKTITFVTG